MEVLLSGLGIPESPRWHDGRLWFANWIENQIVAVEVEGTVETMPAPVKRLMGWSIDWMPDGSLVTTGDNLLRQQADGSFVVHAEQDGNELVVDSRGNAYLNGADFDFAGGEEFTPGYIKLITPDGAVREVADDIHFPNGMVITPDEKTLVISESFAGRLTAFDIEADGGLSNRRVFAGGLGPDGICTDVEGAIWVSTSGSGVVRVAEGGEVLERIERIEPQASFALALGGADRRTLFVLTAEWRPDEPIADNLDRLTNGPRNGQVLMQQVDVPGAGRP